MKCSLYATHDNPLIILWYAHTVKANISLLGILIKGTLLLGVKNFFYFLYYTVLCPNSYMADQIALREIPFNPRLVYIQPLSFSFFVLQDNILNCFIGSQFQVEKQKCNDCHEIHILVTLIWGITTGQQAGHTAKSSLYMYRLMLLLYMGLLVLTL